jgi:hypothetical protein
MFDSWRVNVGGIKASRNMTRDAPIHHRLGPNDTLQRGSCRLEGRARVAGVKAVPSLKLGGASLRVAGSARACEDTLSDTAWQTLAALIKVT